MRLALYTLGLSSVCVVLGYFLFSQYGIDPLAPEVRTIMLLSLVVAGYIGLRIALVVRGFEQRSEASGSNDGDGQKKRNAFNRWGRSSQLDARLDARRERVRRAREAEERGEDS